MDTVGTHVCGTVMPSRVNGEGITDGTGVRVPAMNSLTLVQEPDSSMSPSAPTLVPRRLADSLP